MMDWQSQYQAAVADGCEKTQALFEELRRTEQGKMQFLQERDYWIERATLAESIVDSLGLDVA